MSRALRNLAIAQFEQQAEAFKDEALLFGRTASNLDAAWARRLLKVARPDLEGIGDAAVKRVLNRAKALQADRPMGVKHALQLLSAFDGFASYEAYHPVLARRESSPMLDIAGRGGGDGPYARALADLEQQIGRIHGGHSTVGRARGVQELRRRWIPLKFGLTEADLLEGFALELGRMVVGTGAAEGEAVPWLLAWLQFSIGLASVRADAAEGAPPEEIGLRCALSLADSCLEVGLRLQINAVQSVQRDHGVLNDLSAAGEALYEAIRSGGTATPGVSWMSAEARLEPVAASLRARYGLMRGGSGSLALDTSPKG